MDAVGKFGEFQIRLQNPSTDEITGCSSGNPARDTGDRGLVAAPCALPNPFSESNSSARKFPSLSTDAGGTVPVACYFWRHVRYPVCRILHDPRARAASRYFYFHVRKSAGFYYDALSPDTFGRNSGISLIQNSRLRAIWIFKAQRTHVKTHTRGAHVDKEKWAEKLARCSHNGVTVQSSIFPLANPRQTEWPNYTLNSSASRERRNFTRTAVFRATVYSEVRKYIRRALGAITRYATRGGQKGS